MTEPQCYRDNYPSATIVNGVYILNRDGVSCRYYYVADPNSECYPKTEIQVLIHSASGYIFIVFGSSYILGHNVFSYTGAVGKNVIYGSMKTYPCDHSYQDEGWDGYALLTVGDCPIINPSGSSRHSSGGIPFSPVFYTHTDEEANKLYDLYNPMLENKNKKEKEDILIQLVMKGEITSDQAILIAIRAGLNIDT